MTPAQIRQHTQEVVARIMDHPLGEVKFASDQGSKMLKKRVYEEGFTRRLFPEETVTDADLTPQLSHELPCILREMEGLSLGAKSVPFGASPDVEFFRGDKYLCVFNSVTTPDYTKDLNELRTYRGDIRQLVTNNSLIHMQTEEDAQLIATFNSIVGATNGVGASGYKQNFTINAGITRDSFPDICKILPGFNLNTGCVLMNKSTAMEFCKWNRDEIGGDLAQKIFQKGVAAIESEIFGVKIVVTMKRALVADGVCFVLAEPDFAGHFMSLQAPTMTVKKERDFISFGARETVSLTIPNVASVQKVTYSGVAAFPETGPSLVLP